MNSRQIVVRHGKKTAKYDIKNIRALARFVCTWKKELKGGSVLAISGELGAGKTVFVKALAKELGIKKTVTSPTFVLMNIYTLPKVYHGAIQLCHIDAYRLSHEKDLRALGAEEYIGDSTTIAAIEWPEHVQGMLPSHTIFIHVSIPKK
jgi:tRNA threonylcarbamoyladenosine biosynthesis protein TsaE